jgi:hypothetical protein
MRFNPWKLSTVVLSVALGFTMLTGATSDTEERQPHMKKALGALSNALNQLQSATADKGGHRVKAIGHVKQAIDEVQAGIAADNAN